MAPSVQLTQDTSTFETVYQVDSDACESAKLLKIARGYKNQAIDNSKTVSIDIYGYINSEAQMSSVAERNERAAMQTRFNNIRANLMQMGVPNDKIWIGGVAFSSKWSGQINVSLKDVKVNSILLPPYPPYVPSNDPQKPSGDREQWLDADGAVKKDVVKGEIFVEIELSIKEGGIFRTKPPVSVKASVRQDGTIELGAEWTAIETNLKQQILWGTVQEIKFKMSAEANAGFKIEAARLNTELNAAIKASLSATLTIPGTSVKLPVEVSIGIGADGKVVPGLQTTYTW